MALTPPSWIRAVDAIFRGNPQKLRFVRLGPTSQLLKQLGLPPVDLVMSAGKIWRAHHDHPSVQIRVWRQLPSLMATPIAVFPSVRRDGAMILVLVVRDKSGDPIIVPVMPGEAGAPNVVLSVYGKENGLAWAQAELALAVAEGHQVFANKDFAASVPKPGSAEAIPSSPGPIPADGTAKPKRGILTLRKDSTNS